MLGTSWWEKSCTPFLPLFDPRDELLNCVDRRLVLLYIWYCNRVQQIIIFIIMIRPKSISLNYKILLTKLSYPLGAVLWSRTSLCTWLLNVTVTELPFVVGTKFATSDVEGGCCDAEDVWWCAELRIKSPARLQTSIIWTDALTLLQCA